VLQELQAPGGYDVSVNDVFRPVSHFFDRVWRPEQLPSALLGAMRVLTDPVETGAITIAMPQDVQVEAHDWPDQLFAKRVWHMPVHRPMPAALARAVEVIRSAGRPLIVAGGGIVYREATDELRALVEAAGIPVGQSQQTRAAYDHPSFMGGIGSTDTTAANRLAAEADVVIGIGTRYSDFSTASRTAFHNPDVRFVDINIAGRDAAKHAGVSIVADAREAIAALTDALTGWSVTGEYRAKAADLAKEWDDTVEHACHLGHGPPPAQSEVIGAVNDISEPRDVVVCAAGSMPGDLSHRTARRWRRSRDSGPGRG
jgi:3D-(3,5/4)-trihydroxycyclohexane-1,2-dione acylhydrolase (decyclizing)